LDWIMAQAQSAVAYVVHAAAVLVVLLMIDLPIMYFSIIELQCVHALHYIARRVLKQTLNKRYVMRLKHRSLQPI